MGDYIIYAVLASTILYLIVRLIIHLLEFSMFLKIKENLIINLYNILSISDDNKDMDTDEILIELHKKNNEIKGTKFVEKLELSYGEDNNMILSLTMDNGKSKPKFDFNVELGDIISIKEIKG